MKLIKQSFEIIEQKDFTIKGIKQFIERCARVSYKSENRMTDTSYEKFVGMLESRDHARPLEFGTVHLKTDYGGLMDLQEGLQGKGIYNDCWLRWNEEYIDNGADDPDDVVFITTNYRYYKEMCKNFPWVETFLDESDSPYYPKRYTAHMILDRGVMDKINLSLNIVKY